MGVVVKKRFRFDLRKALFILPNLFTLSSIFCGFYAMLLSAQYASNQDAALLMKACICILFSMVFDSIDGRVARLTKTQSEFGVQMDSGRCCVFWRCAQSLGVALGLSIWFYGIVRLLLFCA